MRSPTNPLAYHPFDVRQIGLLPRPVSPYLNPRSTRSKFVRKFHIPHQLNGTPRILFLYNSVDQKNNDIFRISGSFLIAFLADKNVFQGMGHNQPLQLGNGSGDRFYFLLREEKMPGTHPAIHDDSRCC